MFGSLFTRRQDSFHNEEQGQSRSTSSPRSGKRRGFGASPSSPRLHRPSLQLDIRKNKSPHGSANLHGKLSSNSHFPMSDVASVSSSKFSPDPLALVRKLPVDATAVKLLLKRGKSLIGTW
eukprot:CAMPEP_0182448574 /NCGR_PEP_ID=MMETSP1172-20130603/28242_1 /TAXON_ID=708627 /ORGANISM="Timspurckia oligopyrenoides, Strain CCMP3278" /LENGTH=120 /DNA_ID=CAMNT_0024645503 /DNA_START=38 /DNA_END=397 /DNA_ORIENTATION=-